MQEPSTGLRALTVGCDVRTFSHGLKGSLIPYPCTLEKNDVIFCSGPRMRRHDDVAHLVVPFLFEGKRLLWVPVREMGLRGHDFDWAINAWDKRMMLAHRSHEVSHEEFALIQELGAPKHGLLN